MNGKSAFLVVFFLLFGCCLKAQEQAVDLILGGVYPMETGNRNLNATYKPGLTFGLLFRKINEKGNLWSAGAEYQRFRNSRKVLVNNREEEQTETFEILQLKGMPLTWRLGNKQQFIVEAGAFAGVLLHEEANLRDNVTNNTKLLQRLSVGPSIGIGWQLGQSLRKSLLIGIRDEYSALSFGNTPTGDKAKSLKFNTISLYFGLGI